MSDIDRIKKHITKDVLIKLKNSDGVEDTFYFKPLKIEENILAKEVINGLVKLQKKCGKDSKEIENMSEEQLKEINDIDSEITQKTFDLFISLVKRNFDGIDEDTAENFVQTNLEQLFKELPNLIPKVKSNGDLDSLKKSKERIKSGQNKSE
ncbi:MAG: hypothetical protein ACFFG0_03150 [Candidatus Thorarchaeota archaeon]